MGSTDGVIKTKHRLIAHTIMPVDIEMGKSKETRITFIANSNVKRDINFFTPALKPVGALDTHAHREGETNSFF